MAAYGELTFPFIPSNAKIKKSVRAWNKGLTWEQMGIRDEHKQKVIKNNLSKGNKARWDKHRGEKACNAKAVLCINPKTGNIVQRYESANEARKLTGINDRLIRKVCNGQRKQTGGYKWIFEKDLFKKLTN